LSRYFVFFIGNEAKRISSGQTMRQLSLHNTPTWILLMPSVAAAAFIGAMSDPTPTPPNSTPQSTLHSAAQASLLPIDATSATMQTVALDASPPLKRAKYEPARGAYLGAALDTSVLQGPDRKALLTAQVRDWEKQSGRKHALYLSFTQFPTAENVFPGWDSDPRGWLTTADFCDGVSQAGATPIVTLEPFGNPLQFSRDWKAGSPAYVATENFARGAGKWHKPLFIRFAHEMNGSWYPWAEWTDKNKNMTRDAGEDTGFTAEQYRKAYRNVARMFRRFAPNAALVWCPNVGLLGGPRRDVFRPFYPGDDVVDWVALDSYEKGWTMPMPGAKLWGGQFAHTLTHDIADDSTTPQNESVDFYKTFSEGRHKPLMLCETAASLSYRTDLDATSRGLINDEWKSGYWNPAEYGWMQGVYGTSQYSRASGRKLVAPIDQRFPSLKGIVWFQVAKHEWIPVEKTVGTRKQIIWFDDTPTDYRIGGGIDEKSVDFPFAQQEFDLYRGLTNNSYFLGNLAR